MHCFLSKQCFLSSSTTTNCLQTKDLVQILRKSDVAIKEAAAIMFAIKCDECRGPEGESNSIRSAPNRDQWPRYATLILCHSLH